MDILELISRVDNQIWEDYNKLNIRIKNEKREQRNFGKCTDFHWIDACLCSNSIWSLKWQIIS